MGISSDPRFHAKVGMPLRGNTPRHRIIARLAREGRIKSIWSLNWDCILESALESVGLLPQPNPNATLTNQLPWIKWYCTWLPGDQHNPNIANDSTLHLVKPHGCVNKLATGNASSFITTASEIAQLPTKLESIITGRIIVGFSDAPLITAGWSAEEKYIHQKIEAVKQQGTLIQQGVDKLSVINRSWYPKAPTIPPEKHDRLAATFAVNRDECSFSVENAGEPKLDELFQWLQTRYGLDIMRRCTENQNIAWHAISTELQNMLKQFLQANPAHCLNSIFDDFLAVWVRFCFNASTVEYKNNYTNVPQDMLATHRRDEHIPWYYGQTSRFDLLAAAPLVLALCNSTRKWNCDLYPGGFWNEIDGHLVFPIPAWDATGQVAKQPIELAALKPLVDGWNWSRKGVIKRLSILPLLPLPQYTPLNDDQSIFRNSVAWLMKTSKLSDPTAIEVVSLTDI